MINVIRFLIVAATISLASAADTSGQPTKGDKNPILPDPFALKSGVFAGWEGHRIGSSYKTRLDRPGLPNDRESSMVTLIKADPMGFVEKTETISIMYVDAFITTTQTINTRTRRLVGCEDGGTEELAAGGKSWPCQVKHYKVEEKEEMVTKRKRAANMNVIGNIRAREILRGKPDEEAVDSSEKTERTIKTWSAKDGGFMVKEEEDVSITRFTNSGMTEKKQRILTTLTDDNAKMKWGNGEVRCLAYTTDTSLIDSDRQWHEKSWRLHSDPVRCIKTDEERGERKIATLLLKDREKVVTRPVAFNCDAFAIKERSALTEVETKKWSCNGLVIKYTSRGVSLDSKKVTIDRTLAMESFAEGSGPLIVATESEARK